jgi:hypothetical protein
VIDCLKIGTLSYTIVEKSDLVGRNKEGERIWLNGDIRYRKQHIRIERKLSDDKKLVTLWHEALHGILEQAGINDENETIVIALSYGIVKLLQDNPALVKYTVSNGRTE